ncbi:hypothetical protein BD309DRAFT_873284, partial [Dichomitus squalens]
GLEISKILLTEYRRNFSTIRVTTRALDSPKARELAMLGAELHVFSEFVDDVFSGVDVVVDALPTTIPQSYREELMQAIARQNVKVYFLSEYGLDYRTNDFPGYEHPEWVKKRELAAATRPLLESKTKVIQLVTGIFHGWTVRADRISLFSNIVGIDADNNIFSPLGPGTLRFATTAESDIGRSIARLSILALDPKIAAAVPDVPHIAGHNVSYEEIRDIVARVRGVPKGEIKSEDLKAFKENLSKNPSTHIMNYARVVIGENKLNYTQNDNELVNPGQQLWKWKTIEDYLRRA